MTQNVFGSNIAFFRTKVGLTQAALAERIGVSAQAISKWETGNGYPDVETIPILARYLGTTTDALFGFEKQKSCKDTIDIDMVRSEIKSAISDEFEGVLSRIESIVYDAVEDVLEENLVGRCEGEDKRTLRVLSPNKDKMLCCIGGLRIADSSAVHNSPPNRFYLMVQTTSESWEALCYFDEPEKAQDSIVRIAESIRRGERELSL